jgi:hypothetical protein
MDSKTKLEIKESDFANFQMSNIPTNEKMALENRKDLESIRLQEKASVMFKLLKADTPSISIIIYRTKFTKYNHGAKCHEYVGVSYDLSGILKNGTNVKIAESKT